MVSQILKILISWYPDMQSYKEDEKEKKETSKTHTQKKWTAQFT